MIRNAKVVGSTPIIGTISNSFHVYRNQVPVGGISGGILCSVKGDAPNEA